MTAIFPGSFDPVTVGHVNMAERASRLFDKLIVAALNNPDKRTLFTSGERAELLRESLKHIANVEIDAFSGLLSEYAKRREADVIIRGVRSFSDFGIETERARVNKMLSGGVETLIMVSEPEFAHISSAAVREIVSAGMPDKDTLRKFVAAPTLDALAIKLK